MAETKVKKVVCCSCSKWARRTKSKLILSLKSPFELAGLHRKVLVPTEKVDTDSQRKKINKENVYFPGYIMIKATLR